MINITLWLNYTTLKYRLKIINKYGGEMIASFMHSNHHSDDHKCSGRYM